MAELLRCKSCGYIVEAGRVGEVCPACGVPRKMMEPWKDPLSQRRRFLLGLDLHPIVDHFSVSFSACAVVVALFLLLFPGFSGGPAGNIARVFIGVLPLAVVASYLSGLYDGKLRFRKTSTPVLRRKKLLGIFFFVFAAGAAALTFAFDPFQPWVRAGNVVLEAAGVVCAFLLGRTGKDLLNALFPG